MDKRVEKDDEYYDGVENMERVHDHVGIEKKNWKNTYVDNLRGKDKRKMKVAISIGAMLMEHNATRKEIEDSIVFIKTKRALYGNS